MRLRAIVLAVAAFPFPGARGQVPAGDDMYTRPGRIVAASDGAPLNFYCTGTGSPTVVFESGWGDWAPAWAPIQPTIAAWTRACSYDRAGAGYSGPGPMPRTSVRIAQELHSALRNAGITGPYVLVGHAFGGDPARTFADLYTADVAGLVLEEADAGDVEPTAIQESDHKGQARLLPDVRACRDSIAGGKTLPSATRHGQSHTCAQDTFFRGLPESAWSPELNASLLHIAETKAAMYDAFYSEMEEVPADEVWLQQHWRSLGSRPVRVLTTGNHGVGHLPARNAQDPAHLEYEHQVALAQARWLDLSSNAKQIFVQQSSEYIQFDQPDVLINAIREVYDLSTGYPEMVVLAAGHFTMGSSPEEKSWAASHGGSVNAVSDEAPQHDVSLPSFAMGKYDVTRGEYAAFVRATGYPAGDGCGAGRGLLKYVKDPQLSWEHPGFPQTDRDPVVCVNWQDAHAYIAWLNRKTHGGRYRLPSEAEWEYAARAGTTTKFYWGDDDAAAPDRAWFDANSGCTTVEGLFCEPGQTHPVGAKPPNAFGLYDMAGNVWQWTEDCYDSSYAGAPTDGRANEGHGNCMRVDRGGSWMFPAWLLRPATRERNPADYRNDIMGFRIASTLSKAGGPDAGKKRLSARK